MLVAAYFTETCVHSTEVESPHFLIVTKIILVILTTKFIKSIHVTLPQLCEESRDIITDATSPNTATYVTEKQDQ